MRKSGILRRFAFSALAGLLLAGGLHLNLPHPVRAASFNPSDYFTYTYRITLSQTYVQYGEVFYASVSGTATCTQDAPVQPSEAFIRGRVIAQHVETGALVALNSGYSVTVSPVPSTKGEVFTAVQELPLYFPWDSPVGKYLVVGELIEARFKAGLWFDATSSFPSTQDMGTAFYRVPLPPPPTTPPPAEPPVLPEPPGTEPAPKPSIPAPPATGPVPEPGTPVIPVAPTEEPGAGTPGAPAVPQGAVSLEGLTDNTGSLNSGVAVSSGDGLARFTIELSARITGGEPSPAWLMLARQVEAPAVTGETRLISSAYFVLPGDALFEPSGTLNISYYEAMIPPGLDKTRLVMARWDDESRQWIVLSGCVVDYAANSVSASVQRAGMYAVIAPVSPPRFELSGFLITPVEVASGELVTVQCRVTNSGSVTGYYELILNLNGNLHEVRRLVLEGAASRVVSFGIVYNAAGIYSIDLNGQSGSFEVSGSQHSYSTLPPEVPGPSPEGRVIYWVQVIYGVNLALLLVILFLSRNWLARRFASLKAKVRPGKGR